MEVDDVFLILNEPGMAGSTKASITRVRETRFVIGSGLDADLVLRGSGVQAHHAELRSESGAWFLRSLAGGDLFLNGSPIDGSMQFLPPCEIRIAKHTIQARNSGQNSAISKALRSKIQEAISELHKIVLDRLNDLASDSAAVKRQEFLNQLDRQLFILKPDPELERYLARQQIIQLLINRIHGFGLRSGKNSETNGLDDGQFEPLLANIEKIIQLGSENSPAEKTERVEALVPWITQVQDDLIAPQRRKLAIALLREQISAFAFGLGPLDDLMNARNINDIMVLPSGDIYIDAGGEMQRSGRTMLSPKVAMQIIERIVSDQDRRIDQSSPMVDARMNDGSRLNAIAEPLSINGPALTIRRFPALFTADKLVEAGTITQNVAAFLSACVIAKKNIVICGGTGAGKTTLLSALVSFIPARERIVTIEDTAELELSQTHIVCLQARPPNREGKGEVSIRDLLRNALRMRPDRIIVGECRGGEALDMLQAMNTGHDGSLTTLHANSPSDGLRRLEVLALQAEGIDLPSRALREQIASAVEIVIQITRTAPHRRRVTSICEVVQMDEERGMIVMEEIFTYRKKKRPGGFAPYTLTFTGYVPSFFEDLQGVDEGCLA